MDRLERLVNLVAALIDAEAPLSREQLRERVGGYTGQAEAFRRTFERDKELLRAMGLPLVTEPLDPSRPDEQQGYRIPRERYELPDPALADDELAALRLAAAAVRVEGAPDSTLSSALRKLAGAPAGPPSPPVRPDGSPAPAATAPDGAPSAAVVVPATAAVAVGEPVSIVFAAVAERRRVRFSYRGALREVDPWRLAYRSGRWYLTGWDHIRGDERQYRMDRVEGTVTAVGEPAAFERPDGAGLGPPPPWRLGDDPEVLAELVVDPVQADWAVAAIGDAEVADRRSDGSVHLVVRVTNRAAFRSLVLGFLDHAELVGPPELRAELVGWLAQLAGSDR